MTERIVEKMDKLYMIIPAYNEAKNIERVVEDWVKIAEKYGTDSRLVVIDDGSKDKTLAKLTELSQRYEKLVVLHKENSGHGATVLYGYRYAIENGADFIFQTDSDGQTLPSEFDAFWQLRNEYDMVIGHRKGREDGLSRKFVTKVLKLTCRVCFHVKVTDANTPFRLMKRESLEKEIDRIPKDYNLANVIVSVIFIKKGYKVKFIPITFRPRQGGVNSINMKKIWKIGKKALHDFSKINKIIKK